MRDLEFVGTSEDRHHVVLRDADTGEEFRVAADDRLRAALRGDRARPAQLESQMDSALRPRDIQARIRAGASPEEVADVAQVPVERIMGYAVPVLAEREHIADRARAASVRRRHTEGPSRPLGDTVVTQLGVLGRDADSLRWDSRRREDGRWVVSVTPADGSQVAHFVYDAAGRYAVADDDAARELIADLPPVEDPSTMAVATAVQAAPDSGPVPVDAPDWTEVGPRVPAEPASQQPDDPEDADESGDSDDTDTVDEEPERPAFGAVTRLRRRRPLHQVADPLPLDVPEPAAAQDGSGDDDPTEQAPAPAVPPEPRRRRDRRRASVPSWDEIMFGGGKNE